MTPFSSMASHPGDSISPNATLSSVSGSSDFNESVYAVSSVASGSDCVTNTGGSLTLITTITVESVSARPPVSVTVTVTGMSVPTSSLPGAPDKTPFSSIVSHPGDSRSLNATMSSVSGSLAFNESV